MQKIKDFFRQKFGKSSNFQHRGSYQFNSRKFNKKADWKQILLWIALGIFGLFLFGVLSLGIMIAVLSVGLPDVRDQDKLS